MLKDDIGAQLDEIISKRVKQLLVEHSSEDTKSYIATDSFGEVLEKLIILHIRMWHLEDMAQIAESDSSLANLKRKIDICFKVKRPNLVEAINLLIDDAVVNNRQLREESVKQYRGL